MVKKVQMTVNEKFKEAVPIIDKLEANGFEAYFVGGSVRDSLLGKPIHDVDIATSAFPSEMKNIFKRTVDVGIEHGTVMVLKGDTGYEVTTFRTESTYQDYRRPDSVTFVRSLEEDLMRRDFTINALAMDKNGTVFDYFDGLSDLDKHIIRAVGDPYTRFHEDALRMMRAVRFQATLGFDIESETLHAIEQNSDILEKIAIERVHEEFIKMMKGKNASQAIHNFIATKLFEKCPGLMNHETAFRQMTELHEVITSEVQVWTLFAYFAGLTPNELSKLLKQWKSSNAIITAAKQTLIGLRERMEAELSRHSLYHLGRDLLSEIEWMVHLITGEAYDEASLIQYDQLPIHKKSDLTVDGGKLMRQLNKQGGPWLGELLDDIEQKVLHGKLENDEEALLNYAKSLN